MSRSSYYNKWLGELLGKWSKNLSGSIDFFGLESQIILKRSIFDHVRILQLVSISIFSLQHSLNVKAWHFCRIIAKMA